MKIRARDPQALLLADLVRPSVAEGKPSSADIFSVELKSMEDRDGTSLERNTETSILTVR